MTRDKIKDGGPAFPFREEDGSGGYDLQKGMSLRDYFAGQALVGMRVEWTDGAYKPTKTDADYAEDPNGNYIKFGSQYRLARSSELVDGKKRYRVITTWCERVARDAYEQADAMLAARNAKP